VDFSHRVHHPDQEDVAIFSAVAVGNSRMQESMDELVVASRLRAQATRVEQQGYWIPSRFGSDKYCRPLGQFLQQAAAREEPRFRHDPAAPSPEKHLDRQYRLNDFFILSQARDERIAIRVPLNSTSPSKRNIEPAVHFHLEKELPLLRSENSGVNAGSSQ